MDRWVEEFNASRDPRPPVSVRLSAEDEEHLRWFAAASGKTVSDVLRDQVRALPAGVLRWAS